MVNSNKSPATWATAIALALGCRSQSSPPPPDRTAKAEPMSSQPSAAVNASPLVGPPALVPWSHLPSAQIVEVGPPSGGAIELPGPRTRPVRPWLELSSSPAGVAARVVQGDGAVAAQALRGEQVVPIGAGALAVSARSDGLWVMYRDHLVHHDLAGVERRRVELAAVTLVGAPGDAVWVAGNDQAWHVDAAGAVRGPYPWSQPLTSLPIGAELCARDKREARTLACLSPDGAAAPRQLPFELLPLEQLLSLDGDRAITLQGATLRVRRGAEVSFEQTFQGAGRDAAGRGFAISALPDGLALWQQATAAGGTPGVRRFPRVGPGSLSAASIDAERISLYGQGQVALHRGAAAAELAAVDESAYRQAIFPAAWVLSPRASIAATSGGVLTLAASGPEGVALVPVTVPVAQ